MTSLFRRLVAALLSRGAKRPALVLTGLVRQIRKSDPRAGEFHAKTLFAAPAAPGQAKRAAEMVGKVLLDHPSQRAANVLADAVLVMVAGGASAADVIRAAQPLLGTELRLALPGLRTLTTGLVNRGHSSVPDVVAHLVGVDHRAATELAHSVALRVGDHELATEIAEAAAGWRWMTAPVAAAMHAERALASSDVLSAMRILDDVPAERSAAFSSRYLGAAAVAGDHQRILDYLDSTVHNLSLAAEAHQRFEAYWALGDDSAALAALEDARRAEPMNGLLIRLAHRAMQEQYGDGSDRMLDEIRSLEGEMTDPTMADVTALMASYFHLESVDDVIRVARSTPDDLLGPGSRIHLARTRYILRDFAGALEALEPLHGSWWRWDGEKLRARILLETGDPESALALREHRPVSGGFDEVEFHALLSLRRHGEAFAHYLPPGDRRGLQRVFPRTAHVSGLLDPVKHRLVIAQSGPGDEIMLASLYEGVAEFSEHLTVTCEPRLAPLLRHSFPDIEFLPVRRLPPSELGCHQDVVDRREAGPLAPVVDASALAVGRSADSVMMARSLPEVLQSSGLPATRYLLPQGESVDRVRSRRDGRPLVGVVWRSEMRSPVRDIHYLTVGDLAPLLSPEFQVVCLQHDVTEEELRELNVIAEGALLDVAEFDLRNDFGAAAAVLACCDCVVGIGTTMVELAGAVGTPTVMIQPTHFGTWRADASTCADYWHRSVVVSNVERPWETPLLVEKAREQVQALLAL